MLFEKMHEALDSIQSSADSLKKVFDKRIDSKVSDSDHMSKDSRSESENRSSENPDSLGKQNKNNPDFDKRIENSEKNQNLGDDIGKKVEFDSKLFQNYVSDIKSILGYRIPKDYCNSIKDYLHNNELKKLSSEETLRARLEFSLKKNKLIEKWEKETGKEWPRYKEDVKNSQGNVVRRAGDYYDAHHIIELSYGGPAESWNIVPARYPDKHQNGIHKADSTKKLFPNERVYNK